MNKMKDIKELHDAYWSVWDKLEHKHNHFFAKKHLSTWIDLIKKLNDKY